MATTTKEKKFVIYKDGFGFYKPTQDANGKQSEEFLKTLEGVKIFDKMSVAKKKINSWLEDFPNEKYTILKLV